MDSWLPHTRQMRFEGRLLRRAILGTAAAAAVMAGCAARREAPPTPAAAEPAEPAEAAAHAHAHMADLPATAGPGFMVADVRFMQDMIGHHTQAITMASLAPDHGAGDAALRLAQKIDISQRDEIAMMKRWLAAREQAAPTEAQAKAMMMPGMLTAEQLTRLDNARGPEFDRLFLSFMIQHHEGALQMVDELFNSPGAGQDSDIFRFASDVDADQRDEIYVMQTMLETLAEDSTR